MTEYHPSKAALYTVAGLYIFWGTAQTLSLKWADSLDAPDRFGHAADVAAQTASSTAVTEAGSASQCTIGTSVSISYSFGHPFTQAFFMFCAEASCLVVFVGMLLFRRFAAPYFSKDKSPRTIVRGKDICLPCNPCVWMLPAGADFIASIMQNVGMMLTYASVYQMLRGATVFWVALLSYFWLKRRFLKVEIWGMVFVFIGLTLVGLSSILKSSGGDNSHHKNVLVGNLLIISAQVLHAYQGVCEERLFKLYKVPPLQMVGTEGFYGVGMTLTLLAFLQLVPTATWGGNVERMTEYVWPRCSPASGVVSPASGGISSASVLRSDYKNTSWIAKYADGSAQKVPYDDVVLAFDQLRHCGACLAAILVYIPAGFGYNACQMVIVKYLSAAATVMLGSLRNFTVWMACLMIPSVFGETFSIVQFIGFMCLVCGNVLFQKVWFSHFDAVLPVSVVDRFAFLLRDNNAPQLEEKNEEKP